MGVQSYGKLIHETAMGTKLTGSRYIDDIFPSRTQPERKYYSSLNKLTSTTQFKAEIFEKETNFLDLNVYKGKRLERNRCSMYAPILNLLRPFITLTSLHATNMG